MSFLQVSNLEKRDKIEPSFFDSLAKIGEADEFHFLASGAIFCSRFVLQL